MPRSCFSTRLAQLVVVVAAAVAALALPAARPVVADGSVTLTPGHFFSVDLSTVLMDATAPGNTLVALSLPGAPLIPRWLSDEGQLPFLFGTPPESFTGSLDLMVVYRNASRAVLDETLTLAAGAPDADPPLTDIEITTTDVGLTQLATTSYDDFQNAISQINAQIGNAGMLYLATATAIQPPRFVNPFSPAPPMRTRLVLASTLSALQFNCDSLLLVSDVFTNAGVALTHSTCVATSRPPVSQGSTDTRPMSMYTPLGLTRTRSDFDKSILPAAIIAGIVLLIGILLCICNCCSHDTPTGRYVKRARYAHGQLQRNATKTMREMAIGAQNKTGGTMVAKTPTFGLLRAPANFSESPFSTTRVYGSENEPNGTVSTLPVPREEDEGPAPPPFRQDSTLRNRNPAPQYRGRPDHNF